MSYLSTLSKPGVHEKNIRRFFKSNVYFTEDAPVFSKPLYLLAFVNRSGSNLLAEYLRMTPNLNGFHEQLSYNTVENHSQRRSIESFPEYIEDLSAAASLKDQQFGFKASWDQILMLHRFRIFNMYPEVRIIHIHRQDVLGQAISYHIALQTNQWTSAQEASNSENCKFDAAKISGIIGGVIDGNSSIVQACTILGLPKISVSYEELVEYPVQTMRKLGDFTMQDLSQLQLKEPKIKKQASSLNEDFRDRYLAYARESLGGS